MKDVKNMYHNNINNIMIGLRIIILFLFLIFVDNFPYLTKYKDDTKFNFYRSLMCIFFSFYSLENTINFGYEGISDMFNFNNFEITDISEWFIAYLALDLGKMIYMKNTRWDLYIHHMWCLAAFALSYYNGKFTFIHSFVLINEAISIVSGIDSMHLEDNTAQSLEDSKECKRFRKNIIRYLRIPIWLITLGISYYHRKDIPFYMQLIIGTTAPLLIGMDLYWQKKCDKVIKE